MPAGHTKVPQVWDDYLGNAEVVIHRDTRQDEPAQTAISMPSPTGASVIYHRYVGLEEFEARTAHLQKEVLPTKRTKLSEYDCQDDFPSALAAMTGDVQRIENDSILAGMGEASSVERLVEGKPAKTTDKAATLHDVKLARTGIRPQQQELKFAQTTPRPGAVAAAKLISPRLRIKLPRPGGSEDAAPIESNFDLVIKKVGLNALPEVGDPYRFWDLPQVRAQDQSRYSTAQMRPAREKNSVSRNRLGDLLKLPKTRIGAQDKHPSRSFETIPSQNLRVE